MAMPTINREEILRNWAADAARRLVHAGDLLAARQSLSGPDHGNVPPWAGSDALDFHGTLASIWIWLRAERLTGEDRFELNIASGWSFVEQAWRRFIPTALDPSASDEAPYDCAMVLRAAALEHSTRGKRDTASLAESAARVLSAYLSDLEDLGGREFKDPGFLVWSLAEYARGIGERGLLTNARRFVDRAFGMKAPPAFASEATATDALFDFSSTTATRILSVVAGEGATPFVGAWLRERVSSGAPTELIARPMDENVWNACVAVAMGRAFVVSTLPAFLDAHQAIMAELDRRATDGALTRHRQEGPSGETLATYYYALAVDALVKL